MIVYVAIGNSDDKLPQRRWAAYQAEVDEILDADFNGPVFQRHGFWTSQSTSEWQNACWCVELDPQHQDALKSMLTYVAAEYGQESIAWNEALDTEFLRPTP